MREVIFLILTIIKALVVVGGFVMTFWNLSKGLLKKDEAGVSKAIKYFFGTAGIIIAVSVIEFIGVMLIDA
ncbi:hypothetical protein D770_04840 [Flammeovirgaceae bacterium 311]|nr:hypothetical protein D770_04840 [Flammeovirgaceae bacterium 311]